MKKSLTYAQQQKLQLMSRAAESDRLRRKLKTIQGKYDALLATMQAIDAMPEQLARHRLKMAEISYLRLREKFRDLEHRYQISIEKINQLLDPPHMFAVVASNQPIFKN